MSWNTECAELRLHGDLDLVGAYRQSGYGNLRLRDGLAVGALAVPFAALGVVIVNVVPERAIELAFAALIVYVAIGLLRANPTDRPTSRARGS